MSPAKNPGPCRRGLLGTTTVVALVVQGLGTASAAPLPFTGPWSVVFGPPAGLSDQAFGSAATQDQQQLGLMDDVGYAKAYLLSQSDNLFKGGYDLRVYFVRPFALPGPAGNEYRITLNAQAIGELKTVVPFQAISPAFASASVDITAFVDTASSGRVLELTASDAISGSGDHHKILNSGLLSVTSNPVGPGTYYIGGKIELHVATRPGQGLFGTGKNPTAIADFFKSGRFLKVSGSYTGDAQRDAKLIRRLERLEARLAPALAQGNPQAVALFRRIQAIEAREGAEIGIPEDDDASPFRIRPIHRAAAGRPAAAAFAAREHALMLRTVQHRDGRRGAG